MGGKPAFHASSRWKAGCPRVSRTQDRGSSSAWLARSCGGSAPSWRVRNITLRHDLHALSKFFGYAVKQRWTRENPMLNVEIPSDADAVRMHILTPDEEKHYFSRAAKHMDLHDLGRLMLNQGMRPDEVTSLHRNDIDLVRGQLHIRQGKSSAARRTLDLTSESRQILALRTSGNSMWIFPSPTNPGHHITQAKRGTRSTMRESSGGWRCAQVRPLRFPAHLC